MRKITVFFIVVFVVAWVSYAQAALVFNADFAQDGTYESSWPMKAGEVVGVDIYVSIVPEPGLISMGFKLTYDPAKLSVEDAEVDEINWPYPFEGGYVDASNPGEIHMAGFRLLAGLAGNSIRLGTVRLRCIDEGTSAFMLMDREGDWFVLDNPGGIVLDGDIGEGVLLSTIRPPMLGDVNGDGLVDLADGILVLKVMVQIGQGGVAHTTGDVNGDGKIGAEEILWVLQKISTLR
jgi:Dockerin type I domain